MPKFPKIFKKSKSSEEDAVTPPPSIINQGGTSSNNNSDQEAMVDEFNNMRISDEEDLIEFSDDDLIQFSDESLLPASDLDDDKEEYDEEFLDKYYDSAPLPEPRDDDQTIHPPPNEDITPTDIDDEVTVNVYSSESGLEHLVSTSSQMSINTSNKHYYYYSNETHENGAAASV